MTVVLNEGALRFLLEDEAGPTGQMVTRTANVIAGNGEAVNAIVIPDGTIRPKVDFVVEHSDVGLQAVVGIPFEGRISDYMAQKWEREADAWIVSALMTNWDSQI